MNYNAEPFPSNVKSMLSNAYDMASFIQKKINKKECPYISDLFTEMLKICAVQPEYSVRRNVVVFNKLGYVPNVKSGKVKSNNEFKGLYVLGEEVDGKVIPVYIGISRTAYRRLRQHSFGKKHNECSLAYLMTREKWKLEDKDSKRATITNDDLEPCKKLIQSFKVVLIPVKEDYDLYFYEVALAGILKTKWNSFRTH